MDEKTLKDIPLQKGMYKKLTVEDLREILQKRDSVSVIKKMQNYPNLYYIKLENSSAIITDKFLDALDKEIREAIRINIIKSTIDLTKGLQPIDYGKA